MKWESAPFAFPNAPPSGLSPFPEKGTSRLVRGAIQYAVRHSLPSVTLVHKGNIMKFTEGQFKQWGYELAEEEFGDQVFTWNQYDRIAEKEGKQKPIRHRMQPLKPVRS